MHTALSHRSGTDVQCSYPTNSNILTYQTLKMSSPQGTDTPGYRLPNSAAGVVPPGPVRHIASNTHQADTALLGAYAPGRGSGASPSPLRLARSYPTTAAAVLCRLYQVRYEGHGVLRKALTFVQLLNGTVELFHDLEGEDSNGMQPGSR